MAPWVQVLIARESYFYPPCRATGGHPRDFILLTWLVLVAVAAAVAVAEPAERACVIPFVER